MFGCAFIFNGLSVAKMTDERSLSRCKNIYTGRIGSVLHQTNVRSLIIADTPAIIVRSRNAAMFSERGQPNTHRRGSIAR